MTRYFAVPSTVAMLASMLDPEARTGVPANDPAASPLVHVNAEDKIDVLLPPVSIGFTTGAPSGEKQCTAVMVSDDPVSLVQTCAVSSSAVNASPVLLPIAIS